MLKIQRRKNSDRWADYAAAVTIDEAKEIIQEAVGKSDVTDYRVIKVKLTCKQEIVFVEPEDPDTEQRLDEAGEPIRKQKPEEEIFEDSEQEEEQQEPEEKSDKMEINHSDKEKGMLLDFLRKTIELRRFPKTKELDSDSAMHDYIHYYNTFGSKSNICDMVISNITADDIDPEYMKMLKRFCRECNLKPSTCENNPGECLLEEIKLGKVQKASYGDGNNEKN